MASDTKIKTSARIFPATLAATYIVTMKTASCEIALILLASAVMQPLIPVGPILLAEANPGVRARLLPQLGAKLVWALPECDQCHDFMKPRKALARFRVSMNP